VIAQRMTTPIRTVTVSRDDEHNVFALAIEDRSQGYPRIFGIGLEFITSGEYRTLLAAYREIQEIKFPVVVKASDAADDDQVAEDMPTAAADETGIGGAPLDELTKLAAEPKAVPRGRKEADTTLAGIDEALMPRGYGLLLAHLNRIQSTERQLFELACSGLVDGMIMIGPHLNGSASLQKLPLPSVSVLVDRSALGVPSVVTDDRAATKCAARHLLELGHESFLYIGGQEAIRGQMTIGQIVQFVAYLRNKIILDQNRKIYWLSNRFIP